MLAHRFLRIADDDRGFTGDEAGGGTLTRGTAIDVAKPTGGRTDTGPEGGEANIDI